MKGLEKNIFVGSSDIHRPSTQMSQGSKSRHSWQVIFSIINFWKTSIAVQTSAFKSPDLYFKYYPRSYLITVRKRSLGQGNVFTPGCDSVHRERECLTHCMLGYTPTPGQTPSLADTLSHGYYGIQSTSTGLHIWFNVFLVCHEEIEMALKFS